MGQKWTIFHSLILLPFRVTSTHSVTFYTFWGSSWGVPSTWRAPQRHKGPRASPQTRLRWLTRQKLAKSPPLCPCERETQTLNHWLLPQLWLCCCCSVSLSPPKLPLCVFFPMPGLWVAPGGSGQPQVALGGCVWHCSPCHPQPALSWFSLYSLATLPLLHAGSLHKIYGSCSKIFSFFITSRSSLFLSNLGKPRPCSLKKKKRPWKKRLSLPFCLLTDASHLHDSEKMKAKRSWDMDCKNGLKSFIWYLCLLQCDFVEPPPLPLNLEWFCDLLESRVSLRMRPEELAWVSNSLSQNPSTAVRISPGESAGRWEIREKEREGVPAEISDQPSS